MRPPKKNVIEFEKTLTPELKKIFSKVISEQFEVVKRNGQIKINRLKNL